MAKSVRHFLPLLGIALAAFALTYWLPPKLPILQLADLRLDDFRQDKMHPQKASQSDDIVILKITEKTLAQLPYRSPFDRALLAKTIDHLVKAQVRAIGIDILFDQKTELAKDGALVTSIGKAQVPIIIASGDKNDGMTEGQLTYLNRFVKQSGAYLGWAHLPKDHDGIIRHWPDRQGFAALLFEKTGYSPKEKPRQIAYRNNKDKSAFPSFPIEMATLLPGAWFKERIVLIGADLPLVDRFPTPLTGKGGSRYMPGVFIHAHLLDQLMTGRHLPPSFPGGKVVPLLGMTAMGLLLALLPVNFLTKIIGGLVFLGGYGFFGFYLYQKNILLFDLALPTLNFILAWGGASAFTGWRYRSEKKFIEGAFGHYLDPQLVRNLSNDPDLLQLGGELRQVTSLFTDLASFTKYSEQSHPEDLVAALNIYLEGLSTIIIEEGGTIDKYIGDAVVAFFGAPTFQEDHATRALTAALKIQAFANEFKKNNNIAEGFGETRIGLHSGPAVVGNVGGQKRFDYTAMGDTINVAARLESLNKHIGTTLCVSQDLVNECPDGIFRPVGDLVLKGKSQPIRLFEPMPDAMDCSAYLKAFQKLEEKSPQAQEAFQKLHEQVPNDGLTLFHLNRINSGESGTLIVMEEK